MSKTIFTDAGRALIAARIAAGETLAVDSMIFAYREGLDPAADPAANFTVAAGELCYTCNDLTGGVSGTDTAIFSAVLTAAIGPWTFNIVGLMSGSTLLAVSVQEVQCKTVTEAFTAGNTIIKNFALQIAGAGTLTGITTPAASWQLDFTGQFADINHNHDAAYSKLGHTHSYEPLGAVATHNGDANAHPALRTLLDNKATKALDNITDAGRAVIKSLAVGYPDYANPVGASFNVSYTAAASGWLLVYARTVYVDDKRMIKAVLNGHTYLLFESWAYNGAQSWAVMIPVKAGDTYRMNWLDWTDASKTDYANCDFYFIAAR
ncbi:MAG: phage tail protein [Victivallaceae bacterium]